MSEITKLYELAGVEYYDRYFSCLKDEDLTCQDNCEICDNAKEVKRYPPFTAKKLLNLVKFLLDKSIYYNAYGNRKHWFYLSDEIENSEYREFDETIAGLINSLWQDLTEDEHRQIKEILK